MRTRLFLRLVAVLAVVLIVVAGALYGPTYMSRSRAKRAIGQYLAALTQTLRDYNAAPLAATATPREVGRVENYVTLLKGTNTKLETELLQLDVREVRSSDVTVTAIAKERWRELERNAATGVAKGSAIERTQVIEYTLVPEDGVLKVHLSRVVEGDEN